MSHSRTTTQECAEDYLQLGWSLLPLQSRSKAPHYKVLRKTYGDSGWSRFREEPASAREVQQWFRLDPAIGLGVVLGQASGVVVLDDDNGTHENFDTARSRSARGTHQYFATTEELGTQTFSWGEIRGDGSYVVLPPSIHPDGISYRWEESPLDGPLLNVHALDHLLKERAVSAGSRQGQDSSSLPDLSSFSHIPVPELGLPIPLVCYLRDRPTKRQAEALGLDRSAKEHAFICLLVNQGCTPEEIASYFDHHELPHHISEKRRTKSYQWLDHSIRKAQETREEYLSRRASQSPSIGRQDTLCEGNYQYPRARREGARSYKHVDLHRALTLVNGQAATQWDRDVAADQGCSAEGARKRRIDLVDAGLVTLVSRVTSSGRERRVYLTEKGSEAVERFRNGSRCLLRAPTRRRRQLVYAMIETAVAGDESSDERIYPT